MARKFSIGWSHHSKSGRETRHGSEGDKGQWCHGWDMAGKYADRAVTVMGPQRRSLNMNKDWTMDRIMCHAKS